MFLPVTLVVLYLFLVIALLWSSLSNVELLRSKFFSPWQPMEVLLDTLKFNICGPATPIRSQNYSDFGLSNISD